MFFIDIFVSMEPIILAWPKSIPLEVMFEAQQKFLKENQYRYFLVEPHWMYPRHSTLVENQTSQLNIICQVALWISTLILKWLTLMRCIGLLELSKHWISGLQPCNAAVFMITSGWWFIYLYSCSMSHADESSTKSASIPVIAFETSPFSQIHCFSFRVQLLSLLFSFKS